MKKEHELTPDQVEVIKAYMEASHSASFGGSIEEIKRWLEAGSKVIEIAPKSATAKAFKRIDQDYWLSILE